MAAKIDCRQIMCVSTIKQAQKSGRVDKYQTIPMIPLGSLMILNVIEKK